MNTQSEALRLADILEHPGVPLNVEQEAAAELRRLHESNRELLDLLKDLLGGEGVPDVPAHWIDNARAAIAKHGGAA